MKIYTFREKKKNRFKKYYKFKNEFLFSFETIS